MSFIHAAGIESRGNIRCSQEDCKKSILPPFSAALPAESVFAPFSLHLRFSSLFLVTFFAPFHASFHGPNAISRERHRKKDRKRRRGKPDLTSRTPLSLLLIPPPSPLRQTQKFPCRHLSSGIKNGDTANKDRGDGGGLKAGLIA